MSLHIIKAGMSDTFQDEGRYGYQHLGINPGGAMDIVALKVANALVANAGKEAVLEMHFPAPAIVFESNAMIALSGGDFTATINGSIIPVNCPVVVKKKSELKFTRRAHGARTYLAVRGGYKLEQWLGSSSTNQLVKAGGYHGRPLQTGDWVAFNQTCNYEKVLNGRHHVVLPFAASVKDLYSKTPVKVLVGPQYGLLTKASSFKFTQALFTITNESDRMGYRLQSCNLHLSQPLSLVSSAVTRGTIQLLPGGQLIMLMADHQTTGGYPVVAQVISTDLPRLAQSPPGAAISFHLTDIQTAEALLCKQHRHLLQLQNACTFRLKDYVH